MNICPQCKKNQLSIPLVRNPLASDGRTYICQTCKESKKH